MHKVVLPTHIAPVSQSELEALSKKQRTTLPHWGRADLPRPGCVCFACNLAVINAKPIRRAS